MSRNLDGTSAYQSAGTRTSLDPAGQLVTTYTLGTALGTVTAIRVGSDSSNYLSFPSGNLEAADAENIADLLAWLGSFIDSASIAFDPATAELTFVGTMEADWATGLLGAGVTKTGDPTGDIAHLHDGSNVPAPVVTYEPYTHPKEFVEAGDSIGLPNVGAYNSRAADFSNAVPATALPSRGNIEPIGYNPYAHDGAPSQPFLDNQA